MSITRRKSRQVKIGNVAVGGDAPVSVQSMTKTHTEDVGATVAEINRVAKIGCEIIRLAIPNEAAAKVLGDIKKEITIPLIADIHFDYRLALASIENGADAVRLNPGNITEEKKLLAVVQAAKGRGIPIRIGVNSGSIRPRGKALDEEKTRDLVDLMVDKTLQCCDLFESAGFGDIILSLKASDCLTTMDAYRSAAARCDYPLHLGVTAAGPPETGIIKSAAVIGGLLAEGIGDTIRVSLTGPPDDEVITGIEIVKALELRPSGVEIVSCPTCGRCEVNLIKVVREVQQRLPDMPRDLRIAIMGCVVNGPGEAQEADIGIAGGKGFGMLFRQGKKLRRVEEKDMVDELIKEIRALSTE